MTFAIVCERQRGTSWERIGEALGETAETVRCRYESSVSDLRSRLLEAWLEPERADSLPEGAADPRVTGSRLDAWLTEELGRDAAFTRHPDSEVRARPVSSGLPIMSPAEHRELLVSAARLIADKGRNPLADDGLRRRRLALLEWLLAEELNCPGAKEGLAHEALRRAIEKERRRLREPGTGGIGSTTVRQIPPRPAG